MNNDGRMLGALLLLGAGLLWSSDTVAAETTPGDDAGSWLDWLLGGGMTGSATGNRVAFLAMIRYAEGTAGPDGYRTYFGGATFDDLSKHPNVMHTAGRWKSTAAGAYQFVIGTWQMCQKALNLPDFGAESQDRAALYLLEKCGALRLIDAGDFAGAVQKASGTWASLPGSLSGQPQKAMTKLLAAYVGAGGAVA